MTQIARVAVVAGLALLASSPCFANQAGGPDTNNPVAHEGVAADWNASAAVLDGATPVVEPTVPAAQLTGASVPMDTVHASRYTVTAPAANGGPQQLARTPAAYPTSSMEQPSRKND